MFYYILKRIAGFIPTLVIVTLLGFILLVNSPGDAVEMLVNPLKNAHANASDITKQKKIVRHQLGLDLPLFYFSVSRVSEPDTLYKIFERQNLLVYRFLLQKCGNALAVHNYLSQLNLTSRLIAAAGQKRRFSDKAFSENDVIWLNEKRRALKNLLYETNENNISIHFNTLIQNHETRFKFVTQHFLNLQRAYTNLELSETKYKNYLPKFVWYGFENRYQKWLVGNESRNGIVGGNFGISYIKNEPVINIIQSKIGWSLLFSILSIIIAYFISIPLGIKFAAAPNNRINKITEVVLFILYSMPSCFVGVLLLMLFANPDVFPFFPPSGIKPVGGYDDGANWVDKIITTLPYLILPLVCYTYSSVTFLTRLTQTAVSEQLGFDYIKTAMSKGLSNKKVVWNHAVKNSMLPLITVFAELFPGIIGGSVIIESIFSIPGLGLETIKAINAKDYPIVVGVITLTAVFTMFGYLLADVLYAIVDPRIKYKA